MLQPFIERNVLGKKTDFEAGEGREGIQLLSHRRASVTGLYFCHHGHNFTEIDNDRKCLAMQFIQA